MRLLLALLPPTFQLLIFHASSVNVIRLMFHFARRIIEGLSQPLHVPSATAPDAEPCRDDITVSLPSSSVSGATVTWNSGSRAADARKVCTRSAMNLPARKSKPLPMVLKMCVRGMAGGGGPAGPRSGSARDCGAERGGGQEAGLAGSAGAGARWSRCQGKSAEVERKGCGA